MVTDQSLGDFAARCAHVDTQHTVDAAAAEVTEGLSSAGIDFIVMKGAALAQMLYEPHEHRSYVDLDLLVAPASLPAANAVLFALGFSPRVNQAADTDLIGLTHAVDWTRERDGAHVDLHSRLFGSRASADVVWQRLWDSRVMLDLYGRRTPALGSSAAALQLAIHAAQNGPERGKALGDLERGVRRWGAPVWALAAELAEAVDATDVFTAGLTLVPEGRTVAHELGLGQMTDLGWMLVHRAARPRGAFHVRALAEAPWGTKASILRRALLPSKPRIAELRPVARRGGLPLLLAYAEHLVIRVPLWSLRAWSFRRRALRAARQSAS